MAVRTVTVKASGGDYTSLSNAEAGEQGNLVSLDRQLNIEMYIEDTTAVVIDGWTTDATRYIAIYAPSTDKHDGKWNTDKARMNVASGIALQSYEDYTRVYDMQFTCAGTVCVEFKGAGLNILARCVFEESAIGFRTTTGHGSAAVISCVFDSASASAIYHRIGTLYAYNLTIRGQASGDLGIRCDLSSVLHARNVVSWNTGGESFGDETGGAFNLNYCKSDDTYADNFGGTGNVANVADIDNAFTNAAAGDFHLVVGDSVLKDAGQDLSADPDSSGVPSAFLTYDIDGVVRSGSWDIGADEYVAAGGGAEYVHGLEIPAGIMRGMQRGMIRSLR